MQDRLIKILTVKIEAINKNIDNLNYLNGELLKNNNDLDYINDKISIFKTKDILNFDKIEKEDFEKILLMVDPSIKEIFSDKTCNYQGIMYIIKGIRDGISLDLTANQEEAILKFIESLNVKSEELNETIQNLEESKERLPEVNLNVLEESLENYQRIVNKLRENEYLVEIEEVVDALEFSNLPMEEKIDIFSYILKYNRDIYESMPKEEKDTTNQEDEFDEVKITDLNHEDTDFFEEKDFELPKFSMNKLNSSEDEEKVKINLNNTIDLEDIIQKIDDKIKELDAKEEKKEPIKDVEAKEDNNPLEGINFEDFKLPESVDTTIASPTFKIDPNMEMPKGDNLINLNRDVFVPQDLTIDVPEEFSGSVIEKLSNRKGELQGMGSIGSGFTRLEFLIPSRGLIGYRGEFLTDTKGNGIINTVFEEYGPYKGDMMYRAQGSLIAFESGEAITYGLYNAQERGTLFIGPGEKVYSGMIIGQNGRGEDIEVNVCKKKQLTNTRSSSADEALRLTPPKILSLEQALDFIDTDELLEVTPENLRIRKKILDPTLRKRAGFKK